jgi:hypothetical protein
VCSSHLLSTFSLFNWKAAARAVCEICKKVFYCIKVCLLKGLAHYDGTSWIRWKSPQLVFWLRPAECHRFQPDHLHKQSLLRFIFVSNLIRTESTSTFLKWAPEAKTDLPLFKKIKCFNCSFFLNFSSPYVHSWKNGKSFWCYTLHKRSVIIVHFFFFFHHTFIYFFIIYLPQFMFPASNILYE